MSDKLQDLESELEKLVNRSYGRFNEVDKAFNLGMKIANELTNLKITDYKIECLEDKRSEENKKERFNEAMGRINKFLLKLVRGAVREKINESGNWSVEKRDYMRSNSLDSFSNEIVEKFNVQISNVDMGSYGGDFELEFAVEGELKELFERNNIPKIFKASMGNSSGEEYDALYNEEDAEQIYSCYAEGLHRFNNVEIAEVDKFYDEVTKLFLFKILADDLS
jgi:hypothetical protein